MSVLVTGGAGYIGSHVVRMLIERGYDVVVYDNLCAGHRQAVHRDAHFVEGDLLDRQRLASIFAQHHFDGILHFASHIQVGESMQKPFKYFRDNVDATTNLLEEATTQGVKRFILSSTANLYDRPLRVPISEDEAVIPGSVYGETKAIAERELYWMERIYGMKWCALRYFNASGAHPDGIIGEDHDPETHLIPIVLQVALGQREAISVFGTDYPTPDGTCIRDYIHVDDLGSAHLKALQLLSPGLNLQLNLGTGHGHSVQEVIDACRRVTGHAIPAVEAGRRAGDPAELVADSSLAQRTLDWKPHYNDIEEIVRTAWNWHQSHPNGYATKS